MKKIITLFTFIIILLYNSGFSWELYDRVIAVVNSISIIESEINNKFNQLQRLKKIPSNKISFEKSRVLDKFIEDALVYEAAVEEAIVISDARVLVYIEKMMKDYFSSKIKDKKDLESMIPELLKRLEKKLKNASLEEDSKLDPYLDSFIKYIENVQKVAFEDFFEEVRLQMRREQVMSIAIGVSPPTKEEAMKWYNMNKNKLGYEVKVKHILVVPKNKSLTAEREANKKLEDLRKRIIAGESFEALAKKYSEDFSSAKKGGDLGWTMLAELDPYFAGFVYRMNKIGEISGIFKSGSGYHVVKYLGRRAVSYDNVERLIMFKLYNEKMMHQFEKWVAKRKKESEIKIFMEDYVKI